MSEMAHRVLVIGLDAATFEIVDPLLAQGKMPHLKRLIDQGVRGPLASTHPPLSPAAWTSFMTGKNPGKHGIFDFKNYEPSHYDRRTGGRLVNATQFAGTTVFDIASTAGKKVGAFKVPITYPAWPVNGFMVSGQPLPDTQTQPTAYPTSLMEEVSNDSITFDHHMDAFKQADLDQFIEDIRRSNAKSVQQVLKLLAADDYDLFVLVLTALDEIQHRLWMYTDPACPVYDAGHNARYGQVINNFYCEMDAVVGQILARWAHADDGLVFIISDHGARLRPRNLFNTNVWLRENGWLRLEQENGRSEKDIRGVYGRLKGLIPSDLRRRLRGRLPQKAQETLSTLDGGQEAIDWQRTRAYLFPMYCPLGGIEINLRGRQPQGIVQAGAEYEQIREAILTQLPQIVDPITGKRIISRALRREDLYSGPFLEHTPDIVFFMTEDYDTGWNLGGDLVIPTPDSDFYRWSGFHSTHGVLIARGNGAIRPGTEIANAELMDLAPTLLYALGLPIPKDMDGKVLTQLFAPSAVSHNPPTFTDLVPAPLSAEHVLSDEEEEAMRRRLHGLGYL